MTTAFAQSILPPAPQPASFALLHSIFVEPLLVVATCLFWLVILPISGLACLSVALFDKVLTFAGPKIRLLDGRAAANPLVLRRRAATNGSKSAQPRSRTEAART